MLPLSFKGLTRTKNKASFSKTKSTFSDYVPMNLNQYLLCAIISVMMDFKTIDINEK
jgi:hypothetical protein